jgi:caa(3)-type oxidase subunit IV
MDPTNKKYSHHHIMPTKTALLIGGTLLCLTGVTVWVAGIDLGAFNFIVAMAIATVKALLVALFFMNLIYDRRENGVIFFTAFLFLAIFFTLTATDLFFRGDVYLKGPIQGAVAKSKISKPWVSTPALVAHGKELFAVNCTSCHGPEGLGNGPAASALNPHPRNFHQDKDWVNGRKPSQVFKTLRDGVAGSAMASFATLSSDDRWSLDAYVLSLGPKPPADSPADLQAIGIDPTKENAVEAVQATIPVEMAMRKMAMPEMAAHPSTAAHNQDSAGAQLYQSCVQCHGDHGQGGKIGALPSISTPNNVSVDPFTLNSEGLSSQAAFMKLLDSGIPGGLMPSYGQYSGAEVGELYGYVKSLAH